MVYEIVLSPFMDKQVVTKPPKEGFKTVDEAYKWVLKHYGSTALNSYVGGNDVGCHIIERTW